MNKNNNLTNKKIIFVARPRGFCAGVERAIMSVEKSLEKYGPPIYVRKQIVHNSYVVNNFKKKGVIFINNIKEVPVGKRIIFSAHGVSPLIHTQARLRKLNILDATCPLVTKVHNEVKNFSKKNFEILLIGHRNHEEVEGTFGEAPNMIKIIENLQDACKVKVQNPHKLAWVSQTTLDIKKTFEIIKILKKRFPFIHGPHGDDICYATVNRQKAVQKMLKYIELMIVIGSYNSSNSRRLYELSIKNRIQTYQIENVGKLQKNWFKSINKVGLTAGASVPETLIKEVIKYLVNNLNFNKQIKEILYKKENLIFNLPKNI